jgi:hypothetical protein
MYQLLSRNGQAFGFLLGAVVTGIFLLIMALGWSDFSALGESPERYNSPLFDFGLFISIAMAILGFILIAVFGVFQMASNPKAALRGVLGTGAIVAAFFLAYATSSTEMPGPIVKAIEGIGGLSETAYKLVGGGITTALILVVFAFVAIIVLEIVNFFK